MVDFRAYVRAHPDGEPAQLARDLVATLSDEQARAFAVVFAEEHIADAQRQEARRIEAEAEMLAQQEARRLRLAEQERRAAEAYEQRRAEEREYRKNAPARRAAREAAKREAMERRQQELLVTMERFRANPHARTFSAEPRQMDDFYVHFRHWMGDDFDDWYSDAVDGVARRGSQLDLARFRAEWESDFVRPEFLDHPWAILGEAIKDYTQSVRLRVTQELLETSFALGDGRRVTWGDATIDEHEQRIAFLTNHAAGTLETAGRHQAAIGMLAEANAACLRDLAGEAAA
ncbi:MAG: hypothetical protein ACJ77I_06860 [Chloroflexota bacterium]